MQPTLRTAWKKYTGKRQKFLPGCVHVCVRGRACVCVPTDIQFCIAAGSNGQFYLNALLQPKVCSRSTRFLDTDY
jgi:hypothetical protein